MWWNGLAFALCLVTSTAAAQDAAALEASARAADAARDLATGDERVAAAERAIAAWQLVLDTLVASGELGLRDEPPEASGDPPHIEAIPLPPALAGLVTARGRYLGLPGRDPERAADHDLANARVLFAWGHVELARERLWRIYLEHCRAESERAQIAWTSLYQLAVRLDDHAAAEALARHFEAARCAGPSRPPSDDPADPRNMPTYMGRRDDGVPDALGSFTRAEEARAAGRLDDARGLFERAATLLLEAADRRPDHPEAPRALLLAGQALTGAGLHRAAARVLSRAVERAEHVPAEDPVAADHLLGIALHQLGEASRLALEPDAALAAWQRLTAEERFARSEDPEMPTIVRDALAGQVRVLRELERGEERIPLLERLLGLSPDRDERRAHLVELFELVAPARVVEVGDRLLETYDDTPATLADRLAVLAAMEERSPRGRARAGVTRRIEALVATVAAPPADEAPSEAARFVARRELAALEDRVRDLAELRGRRLERARGALQIDLEAMGRWRLPEIDREACGLLRQMGPSGSLATEPPVCDLPSAPTPPRTLSVRLHASGSIDQRE